MFVTFNHSQLTTKDKKLRTSYRFYLDPINAVKMTKTLNSNMLKKANWTALLKKIISRKKITKPIQKL